MNPAPLPSIGLVLDALPGGQGGDPGPLPHFGLLLAPQDWRCVPQGRTTLSASLTTGIPFASVRTAQAATTAGLSAQIRLQVAINAAAVSTADLTVVAGVLAQGGDAAPLPHFGLVLQIAGSEIVPQQPHADPPAGYFADPGYAAIWQLGLQGVPGPLQNSGIAAQFEATPAAIASTAASLSAAIRLAASPAGSASLSAGLSNGIRLASSPAGRASLTPALATSIELSFSNSAEAVLLADLETSVAGEIAVQAIARAQLSAELTTSILMESDMRAVARTTIATAAAFDAYLTAIASMTVSLSGGSASNSTGVSVPPVGNGPRGRTRLSTTDPTRRGNLSTRTR